MKLLHLVGARPNFMKAAPVLRAVAAAAPGAVQLLVHTGQHYDARMSAVFFDELGLPKPDEDLGVGSGPHGAQTGQIMERFERVVEHHAPDWVVVYGDVNSTVAGALVSAKMGVRCAHVEAGLRSYDRTMPEEINRLVTDQLADLLLTSEPGAAENLAREGIPPARIVFVGNAMIDTLVRLLPQTDNRPLVRELAVEAPGARPFVLVTLHRPGNVDDPATLAGLMAALDAVAARADIVFPMHPRTRARLTATPASVAPGVKLLDPLGYLDFLALQRRAAVVLTDSGGVQEETTYLGVPCLTVRPNTERPVTITHGTNTLVSGDPGAIARGVLERLERGRADRPAPPPLWDGQAGVRIANALIGRGEGSR